MTLEKWLADLESGHEEALANRRYLHQHPELSYKEEKTAQYIIEQLTAYGITDIQPNFGNGYGIVAKIKGEHPGLTIALRADFDALAITEETDVPFISENEGVMHACGHDVHTAGLLSVAKVLQNNRSDLHGNVVLIHQNAEEIQPGGAKFMVEAGALEGVDFVFGIHVSSLLPKGMIAYSEPYGSANSDTFKIDIQGKGGHAAHPSETVDSIVIASQIITNLQTLVSRKVDPIEAGVLTFASVKAGGDAYNIIADTAKIVGTVRTLDAKTREVLKNGVVTLPNVIASIQGGTATTFYRDGYPAIQQSEPELKQVVKIVSNLFGEDKVVQIPTGMGGEDFSYYVQEKPGCFFYVGGNNPDIDAVYPHHHPKFKLDESCLLQSGQSFLAIVAHYLTTNDGKSSK